MGEYRGPSLIAYDTFSEHALCLQPTSLWEACLPPLPKPLLLLSSESSFWFKTRVRKRLNSCSTACLALTLAFSPLCLGEMIKSGRLSHPYKGIVDCAKRTYGDEGLVSCKSEETSLNSGGVLD
jgi:hypothetical protein